MHRWLTVMSIMSVAMAMSACSVFASWNLSATPFICYINYQESLPRNLKSTEFGTIPGIGIQLTHASTELSWTSDIHILSGDMIFDGTNQAGVSQTAEKRNDFIHLETAVQSGIAKLGIGSDIWNRDLVEYSESYSRHYALVGAIFPVFSDSDFSAAIDITATLPFQSKMGLVLPLTDATNHIDFTLQNQIGWKVTLPMHTKIANLPIIISPYAEWYGFGASEVSQIRISSQEIVNLQEPSSTTLKIGIGASVSF